MHHLAVRNPEIPTWGIVAAAVVAALAAGWVVGRTAGPGQPAAPSWTYQNWGGGARTPVVAVGQPSDPEVAAWLAKMERAFANAGVDTSLFRPEEFLHMEEAPGNPVAIPHPDYWPRLIQTIVLVVQPLRRQLGKPIRIYSGFRPESYNMALENASRNSRHMWAEGVDFGAWTGDPEDNRTLARMAASMFRSKADAWDMGMGIYGTKVPSVHADTGFKRRTWADTDWWLDQVTPLAA